MGQVISSASMSLDGYIARHDNTIGQLFDWLQNGDVEVPTVDDRITCHIEPDQRRVLAQLDGRDRCAGLWTHAVRLHRRMGWSTHHGRAGGRGDAETPTDWVEAHPDAPFHFVTDGVEVAVVRAQELAGNATVAVTAGTITRVSVSSSVFSMQSPSIWCQW